MNYAELAGHSPVFAAWIRANNEHNLQAILDCYGQHVSMFATLEDFVANAAERKRYFINFLANTGIQAEVNSLHALKEGDTTVLHGDYTFTHHKGGPRQVIPARYTMVVQNGKITHHHSSKLAGTQLAETEFKIQELETVADQAVSPALKIKASFCNLTPMTSQTAPLTFGFDGLAFGRVTKIFKNGTEVHKHVSFEPNSSLAEKIEQQFQLRAAS